MVQVLLVLAGFPLHFEQVNIDLIIWYSEKSETSANYKSLAVCNIAMRSCCLLEFHFRPVGLVLQTVSLEEDTLVRHIHKYKFNMWSDQIHIAYLYFGSDQCLTRVVQSSSDIFSTGDV